MQENGKKDPDSDQPTRRAARVHDRTEGHAIDQGVQSQAQRQANPTEAVNRARMRVAMVMVMMVVIVLRAFFRTEIMLVKMKYAQQQ